MTFPETEHFHRFAILIAARNEAAVIGHLLESIQKQQYPSKNITVFVVADNCSDSTAQIARNAGAVVWERQHDQKIGKGFALQFLLHRIKETYGYNAFDGYLLFDADNLLAPQFLSEMNKAFSAGYQVITGYRNTKNYGTNWISAGSALWFLRDCKFLNNARMLLHTSAAVAGTGFLIHRELIEKNDGWNYSTLTEDTEFTAACILEGRTIAYCSDAVFFDEQPTTFRQSWNQRLRWTKGYLQVFRKYGKPFLHEIFCHGNFACLDILLTYFPAVVLGTATFFLDFLAGIFILLTDPILLLPFCLQILTQLLGMYLTLFFIGIITGISEWNRIYASMQKKLLYFFTFPIFIMTYIPISVTAIFKHVEWTPILHTAGKSIDELRTK